MAAQNMEALAKANEIRLEGVRQRRALMDQPASVIVPALLNPTKELGRFKLCDLICRGAGNRKSGLIRSFGPDRLRRTLKRVASDSTVGRHNLHDGLRLDELTERERRRLVVELLRAAPRDWSEGWSW